MINGDPLPTRKVPNAAATSELAVHDYQKTVKLLVNCYAALDSEE